MKKSNQQGCILAFFIVGMLIGCPPLGVILAIIGLVKLFGLSVDSKSQSHYTEKIGLSKFEKSENLNRNSNNNTFSNVTVNIAEKSEHSNSEKINNNNNGFYAKNNNPKIKFYSINESINLFDHELISPFIYVSDSKYTDLPFLISAKVTPDFAGTDTQELGYWPNYSNLNYVQKGKFIKWLATGKNDPNIDLGYVYIYYYGLEYRALVEKLDKKIILFEVMDLVSKYDRLRYGFDLIIYLVLEINDFNNEDRIKLLQFIENNSHHYFYNDCVNAIIKKLSPEDYKNRIQFSPYQFMPNNGNEYYGLSDRKTELLNYYLNKMLKNIPSSEQYAIRQQKYSYYIAMNYQYNNSYQVSYESLLPSQQVKKIWNKGRKALKNLEYTIKKFDNTSNTLNDIEKYVYLPDGLRKDISLLNEKITFEDGCIINVLDLIKNLNLPIPNNITLRQSEFVADTCDAFGYCIEPDARHIQKAYKKDSKVIIFEKNFKTIDVNLQTYTVPSILLDLGFKIALEDEELLDIEIEYIMNFIFGKFPLNQIERQRLQYRAKLIKETADAGAIDLIKKLLEKSTPDNLDMICKFLVAVAAADGIIKSKEFTLLKKCFSQFGLAEEYLNNLLSELSLSDTPIIIQKASDSKKKGSKIPKQNIEEPKEEIKFVLNKEKLSNILIDTSQVQNTLNEIFTDEIAQSLSEENNEENNTEIECKLEPTYFNILKILIEKQQWSSRELMTLVQNVGLMLNSTIDKINEWSDEEYGDFLIEEDDNVYLINQEILAIMNKNKGELEWTK